MVIINTIIIVNTTTTITTTNNNNNEEKWIKIYHSIQSLDSYIDLIYQTQINDL